MNTLGKQRMLGLGLLFLSLAIGPDDFPPGSFTINFHGLIKGTEVNGLDVGGALFGYSLGDLKVVIDSGPGQTHYVSPPNVVSIGDPSGTIKVSIHNYTNPGVYRFGFGYDLDTTGSVAAATTITLYNGNTFVGSLSYDSSPDDFYTGGFAGIASSLPFDTAYVTFNTDAAPAWAFDNVMYYSPEPGTLLLMGSGVAGIAGLLRRRFSGN